MSKQTEVQKAINAHIKQEGLAMCKLISSGGLFSSDVYDTRRAYTVEDALKLTAEGFKTNEDMGVFLLNAFIKPQEPTV